MNTWPRAHLLPTLPLLPLLLHHRSLGRDLTLPHATPHRGTGKHRAGREHALMLPGQHISNTISSALGSYPVHLTKLPPCPSSLPLRFLTFSLTSSLLLAPAPDTRQSCVIGLKTAECMWNLPACTQPLLGVHGCWAFTQKDLIWVKFHKNSRTRIPDTGATVLVLDPKVQLKTTRN